MSRTKNREKWGLERERDENREVLHEERQGAYSEVEGDFAIYLGRLDLGEETGDFASGEFVGESGGIDGGKEGSHQHEG
jgi:hypothetical protein